MVEGYDLRMVSQASYRSQIGVVFQDVILLNTTLRENISLVKPDATDEDIEAAARAAEIHETIMEFPDGYQTAVGERGKRLALGGPVIYSTSAMLTELARTRTRDSPGPGVCVSMSRRSSTSGPR